MRNWSGRQRWSPSEISYPTSEAEVAQLVGRARDDGKRIRVIGTGHSFTPLCVTDQILVSLDKLQGLVTVDQERGLATVKAGTKLSLLGEILAAQGLAMENLGDIDAQSIAGTISTGTHGTGLQFGTISTQVRALRFVNGKGEVLSCSKTEHPDLFRAAAVSLGALGVITEITLQCIPAYRLRLENRREELAAVLSSIPARYAENRNFEFYCFPGSKTCWTKTSNLAEAEPDKSGIANYLTEYVLENYAFKVLCEMAYRFPKLNGWVARTSAASVTNVSKVYPSHKVYATPRLVRFNEMEYSIPIEAHAAVVKAIMDLIQRRKFPIHFPIENRVVKADDLYLSPAHGRDSAYIACHAYHKKAPEPYFRAVEEIMLAHEGRPHWGKLHTLTANQLAERYPAFDRFLAFRDQHDPNRIFTNSYLQTLFGN